VPGIAQQVYPREHGVFWYFRHFECPSLPGPRTRALLRFEAVEYYCEVWLNGQQVGGHEGSETPFELDATWAVNRGENAIVLRVVKPGMEPIDGLLLSEIPHRHQSDYASFQPGLAYNIAGVVGRVTLTYAPEMRVADIAVRPNAATGELAAVISVRNDTATEIHGGISIEVAPAGEGPALRRIVQPALFAPGETQHELSITVPEPCRWSPEDPVLYRVTARAKSEDDDIVLEHDRSVRTGFRDLCVVDGYFQLNGKRIFLRCAHTGNWFPISQVLPPTPDLARRDLVMAKAAGFNCLRFIGGVALPEQLDLADEIGLMVYEETYASWCMGESPRVEERYNRSYDEMIRRDRNHPSVVIWGMINEMGDGKVFRAAVAYLPRLRALDPTRLVLLASGRWDAQPTIGSVCNPGNLEWEPVWGVEGPDAPKIEFKLSLYPGGYVDRAGDAHVYVPYPLEERWANFVRTLGAQTKPVFLSEFGIGSLYNPIDELREFDRFEARDDLVDREVTREIAEKFVADLQRFGLDQVYPFPADFFRESYRLHALQRRLAFDLVRSNPMFPGLNLTSLVDGGLAGEGLWTSWRRWKPGIVEALEDGWSPLRWCLFVEPGHTYRGRPLRVEAVLANENALRPGTYPVRFRIWGPPGVIWEIRKSITVTDASLASTSFTIPVLKEELHLDLPAGEYNLAAELERGGDPTGDRLTFWVTDAANLPRGTGALAVWGLSADVRQWLERRGFACREYLPGDVRAGEVVLVGVPPSRDEAGERWGALHADIDIGATAVLASAEPFRTGIVFYGKSELIRPDQLPWGPSFSAHGLHDFLYHREVMSRRHPVFEGLPAGGILDWRIYGPVVGHDGFDQCEVGDDVAAAGFAAGYAVKGGYDSGVVVGARRVGKGRLVYSGLDVLTYIDAHPAADRLLLNLIRYAQSLGRT